MAELSHIATCHVLAPADFSFLYLSDPIKLGRWSLGCFDTKAADETGLHTGLSLFDGGQGWYRIEADKTRLTIDFLVGAPDRLSRRISARIMPGDGLAYPDASCLASLISWRPADMGDDRWARLRASHEAEIWLIKAQIEAEYGRAQ
ncbi:MAG: hypothetical protein ABWZ80_02440 [Beijerinckiaceae bacterium]